MAGATDTQVEFALGLLTQNGFSTGELDGSFAELGATERDGTVEAWLRSMGRNQIDTLIDGLLARLNREDAEGRTRYQKRTKRAYHGVQENMNDRDM